ncbi:MAG: 50S ribosomal protein L18Ae [Candidatus Hydrothermarchaeota archaeon]
MIKKYEILGRVRMGRIFQKFKKEYTALNQEDALEKVYSHFGSKHRKKRREIIIESIRELTEEKGG